MMQAWLTLLVDVLVAGFLGTTIYFCWRLNRRIAVLQDSKGDMAQLIRQFDESTARASAAIEELQDATKKLQDEMGAKLQKANFLADDLAFMIEKGNKVAERMLGGGGVSPASKAAGQASAAPAPMGRKAPSLSSAEEAPPAPAPKGPRLSSEPASGGKASAALENVMRGLAKPEVGKAEAARPRSKAEQDLMDALKNDR